MIELKTSTINNAITGYGELDAKQTSVINTNSDRKSVV